MKIAKPTVLALCVSGLLIAGTASAQFRLPHLGSSSTSSTDTAASQDSLVQSFIASQSEVLAAQALLAKAYGLKEQADACEAQEAALKSSGTDADTLKKAVDISDSANAAISEQQAKQATLTTDEKAYYAQSLPHFAKGVVGTRNVVSQAEKFTESAKGSAGLSALTMGVSKLKAGLFVAKSMPSYSKSLYDVFRKTVSISQNNGVAVPSDATAALQGL